MINKFSPLGDKLLVHRITNDRTDSGLYIPDAAQEKGQLGIVLAKGPGKREKDMIYTIPIEVGAKVYFGKYSGTEIDKEHLILSEQDILGVIKE